MLRFRNIKAGFIAGCLATLFCFPAFAQDGGMDLTDVAMMGGGKPALDLQFSGTWSYALGSFTVPGTGQAITSSRTSLATLIDSGGLLTYAPNNLLTYSNTFTNAAWTVTNITISNANAVADPFGGTQASTITGTGGGQMYNLPAGALSNAVNSIWIRRRTGTGTIQISDPADSTNFTISPTSVWQQFSEHSTASSTFGIVVKIATSGDAIDIYAATASAVTHETTAAQRPQDQVITTSSAYYGPRLDYNPATLAANELLIEGVSTNLALQSNTFSSATWTKDTGLTSVTQNATGIDGTTSAWTVLAAAGTGSHWLYQSQGSSNYTYSVYAKAGTANWIAITDGQSPLSNGVYFNVSTGTVGTTNGIRFSNPTITSIGNGFYRCTGQVTSGGGFFAVTIQTANNQTLGWAAAGTETVIITDAQSEALAFPTSYIPTGASQTSRAADVDSQAVSALQTGSALLVKAITPNNNVATQVFAALDDATTNNYVRLIYATNGHVEALIESGGSLQATIDLGAVANSTLIRVGVNFVGGQFAASLNGGAVVTASGTMPASLTTVRWGMASSGSQLNSWVQRGQIYRAINNNQLQAKVAAL